MARTPTTHVIIILLIAGGVTAYFIKSRATQPSQYAADMQKLKISEEQIANAHAKIEASAVDKLLPPAERELMQKILARYGSGDYGSALALADGAWQNPNYSQAMQEWLKKQMPTILISQAFFLIKQANCQDATHMLERAQTFDNTDPASSKGLAFCYHKLQSYTAAKEQFDLYLSKKTDDRDMRLLYVDVLESDGQFQEALTQLEMLGANKDSAKDLSARTEAMRAKLRESEKQNNLSSEHFQLTYRNEEHAAIADMILMNLEQTLQEFVDQWNFVKPSGKIAVILYPRDTFQQFTHAGPSWAGGIFDGRVRVPVGDVQSERERAALIRTLRHECTHAVLAHMSDFRPSPVWFNEGLAQRLECAAGAKCSADFFPPAAGDFLPQQDFIQPFVTYERVKAERAYRQSLYLMHALEHQDFGEGAHHQIQNIVKSISPQADLSSDGILKPIKASFKELYDIAKDKWQQREQFAL